MGSQWDRKPAWVEALPYEEEPERPGPTDGFGPGPRHASVLSGNMVSYGGKAGDLFWMHPSIGRVERVLALTQLAEFGATRTMDLCRICGMSHKKAGATLRGLAFAGLIASRVVPGRLHGEGANVLPRRCGSEPFRPHPSPPPEGEGAGPEHPHTSPPPVGRKAEKPFTRQPGERGGRRGHPAREWSITQEGRRWLWRLGWVTRCAIGPACDPIPFRDDVPKDPVAAVRSCVHRTWLRPNGLAVAFFLRSGWRPLSLNRMCRLARMNPGIAQPLLKRMVAGTLAEAHPTKRSLDAAGVWRPMWQMSAFGELAFLSHVDALRRAALSTGFRPEPGDPAYAAVLNRRGEFYIAWEPDAAEWGWSI